MIYEDGDLFGTFHKIIGHGVNCKGVMGAGVALGVKKNFPVAYETYLSQCASERGLNPGEVQAVLDGDKIIFNMATQNRPGPDATYDNILKAATNALTLCKSYKEDFVAIPRIGSRIGGLEWSMVDVVLQAAEIVVGGPQFVVYTQGKASFGET